MGVAFFSNTDNAGLVCETCVAGISDMVPIPIAEENPGVVSLGAMPLPDLLSGVALPGVMTLVVLFWWWVLDLGGVFNMLDSTDNRREKLSADEIFEKDKLAVTEKYQYTVKQSLTTIVNILTVIFVETLR